MEEWLHIGTKHAIVVIDAMALVTVCFGSVQAFVSSVGAMLQRTTSGHELRSVWLRYARWLVAALTFQLAADIIETALAPTLQDIARLGAIAVIRTFLNYFLERDLTEVRERDAERRAEERR